MEYQEFVTLVKTKMEDTLGGELDIRLCHALKNNGKERTGINIRDKRSNISPTIYLEEYYNRYLDGEPMESIADGIMRVYRDANPDALPWQLDVLGNFTDIKDKIVFKLIHAGKNEKMLKTLPHIPCLDLAIVFYVLIDVSKSGSATLQITNELLERWNVTLRELHVNAIKNAATLLPARFTPMLEMINELTGQSGAERREKEPLAKDDPDSLYVLTNSIGSFGAGCILYEGMLKRIGNKLNENYYVLPSSIHEVIIVPESKSPKRIELDKLVRDANRTQVAPEEVLSDHAYYYDRVNERLS